MEPDTAPTNESDDIRVGLESEKYAFVKFGAETPGVDDEPSPSCGPSFPRSTEVNTAAEASTLFEISQLVEQANLCFKNNKFEEAIDFYSQALMLGPIFSFVILSNRCASFCCLSENLKTIPAAQSERRALFGFDPTTIAELGLRDAEKLLKVAPNWPKSYYRKAVALTLLEKYREARECYLEGLQIDPLNKILLDGLRDLEAELSQSAVRLVSGGPPNLGESGQQAGSRLALSMSDEFECSLCLKLLYNPVTTPCGHTFCRACLVRALDHRNKCPFCRTVLFVSAKSYPVTVTLQNILERNFPEEYRERARETQLSSVQGREIIPLFVMDVVVPGQKMALNIFEPRYRLMVRRCMEGNHKMGMVGYNTETREVADVACEVEITECEPLPDGRFYLEVLGQRRFLILQSWEQDGYRMAEIEYFQDAPPALELGQQEQLAHLSVQVAELARTWIARIQESSTNTRRARVAEVIHQAGDMPSADQPERLSFWLAKILPLRAAEKLLFLRTTDTFERLTLEMEYLRTDRAQGCRLQ